MLEHCFADHRVLADFQYLRPTRDEDPLWAFNEFSQARLGDLRLTSRLQYLGRQFLQQPLAAIPQACGQWSQSKAAYRFCANDKVHFQAILEPHYARTLERVGQSAPSVILCPQDTTALSYNAHPATQGLGHLGTKPGKSLGMFLHATLALSPAREFFGLLQARCWSRPKRKRPRTARRRQCKALREKETFRWLESFRCVAALAQQYPQAQWVSICDREGDIFELLQAATRPSCQAGLLVRARHDRALVEGRGKKRLFAHLRGLPPGGNYTAHVPRQEEQPAREAVLSVSWSALSLASPRYHGGQAPVELWAVWARELNPPLGQKPICWCLLSTVAVHSLAEAIERIEWYLRRWTCEEYHRVLKSGCQIEARQLATRERLQRALAIDLVVAWRIMDLNKAARQEPDASADRWLSTAQWQALYCYWHGTRQAPATPPTIAQAVQWIAQLGGFLARKGDGRPGPMTLWRGWQRLNDIVRAWQAFGPASEDMPPGKLRCDKRPKRCG